MREWGRTWYLSANAPVANHRDGRFLQARTIGAFGQSVPMNSPDCAYRTTVPESYRIQPINMNSRRFPTVRGFRYLSYLGMQGLSSLRARWKVSFAAHG